MPYVRQSIQLAERGYELATDRAFLKHNLRKMLALPGGPGARRPEGRRQAGKRGRDRRLRGRALREDGPRQPRKAAGDAGPQARRPGRGRRSAHRACRGAGEGDEARPGGGQGRRPGDASTSGRSTRRPCSKEPRAGSLPTPTGRSASPTAPSRAIPRRMPSIYEPQTTLTGVIEKETGTDSVHRPGQDQEAPGRKGLRPLPGRPARGRPRLLPEHDQRHGRQFRLADLQRQGRADRHHLRHDLRERHRRLLHHPASSSARSASTSAGSCS